MSKTVFAIIALTAILSLSALSSAFAVTATPSDNAYRAGEFFVEKIVTRNKGV